MTKSNQTTTTNPFVTTIILLMGLLIIKVTLDLLGMVKTKNSNIHYRIEISFILPKKNTYKSHFIDWVLKKLPIKPLWMWKFTSSKTSSLFSDKFGH